MTYSWQETYKVAVLETNWINMPERLQAAELKIQERQHVLSLDHGGTPEERRAIADALGGIRTLRIEVAGWRDRQGTTGDPG